MTQTALVAIGVVLVAVLGVMVFAAWRNAKREGTSVVEEVVGICQVAFERSSQKEARKGQALALLQERGELGNAEIREALGVSSRSVRRYPTELERERRVEQVGETGRNVVYRLPAGRQG